MFDMDQLQWLRGIRLLSAAAAAGNNNNGSGCCSNVDRLDSNSYGWYFPVSSIGGTGIVDATHVPRSSADTYTNAITKLDYWIYENLVDTPPAPTYLAENNSFSSINFYWANPQQFKLNFLTQTWAPYMSSITIHLYSNVQPHSSNLWLTYTYGNQYVPHGLSGSTPLVGVEFMNNLGNGWNQFMNSLSVQPGSSNQSNNIVPNNAQNVQPKMTGGKHRRRGKKGGYWGAVLEQAAVPLALLGMQQFYGKRHTRKHPDHNRSFKRRH